MKPRSNFVGGTSRRLLAVTCALMLGAGNALADLGTPAVFQVSDSQNTGSSIPPDQLDSLVAPIALYPDPLLAQTLAASTYPLELMQLQQWLTKNPGLKDKALADAVAQQPWDPSIQAMAVLPDVVKWLSDDIQWTTDLGNAFLAQQSDVMDAVQRMRQKAQAKGNLKSTEQQMVETRVVEEKQVIVIEQASPEVVYVPSYDPVVVYGAPVYPYPPIYYPPAGTTPPGWRSRSALVSPWARSGETAEAGAGAPAGGTTTSTSTTTTISIGMRTSTIASGNVEQQVAAQGRTSRRRSVS